MLLLDATATMPETRLLEQCEPIELAQGFLLAPDGLIRSAAGETLLGCLQGLQDLSPDAATPQQIELAQDLLSDEDGNARCEAMLIVPELLTTADRTPPEALNDGSLAIVAPAVTAFHGALPYSGIDTAVSDIQVSTWGEH